MGKRLIQQRRGRGTLTYKSPSHRFKAKIKYPQYSKDKIEAEVQKLLHSPGFSAPLAKIKTKEGETFYNVASEKMFEGQGILLGDNKKIIEGNVLTLSQIPEGTHIYNLEIRPGDGGKLVRSAGSSARIRKQLEGKVIIVMPSKKEKTMDGRSRATIGRVAADGRKDKPVVKAGKKFHMMKATNKLYPRTSPVKMNAIDHPFGGGRGKVIGKPKTPPTHASAGRKVGLIRARRTGRKKK